MRVNIFRVKLSHVEQRFLCAFRVAAIQLHLRQMLVESLHRGVALRGPDPDGRPLVGHAVETAIVTYRFSTSTGVIPSSGGNGNPSTCP